MDELVKVVPISGFPEWLPNKRLVEEQFVATIREQYQRFGFAPIETPAVERMEVLTAKGGMHRQIYTLGRPAEGDSDNDAETGLGLHFDLTVPLARYVVQHAEELVFPFRRYQIQKVWRGERAQKGRFREFFQCDIDVVGRGSLDLIHDAEIPCVINSTFTALGLPEFQVRISNRRVLGDLLSVKDVEEDQLVRVLRAIDKSHAEGREKTIQAFEEEGVAEQLVPAILDVIDCQTIDDARQVFATVDAPTGGLDELAAVIENAHTLGMPEARLRPDFRIARGLDYYTGTIYETFVDGYEQWGSICSGGRYDDLASNFSKQKFPGVGISIGLSRLLDLLVRCELVDVGRAVPTQVLVTTQDRSRYLPQYLGLAKTLREAGIATEVYLEPNSLGKQIGYASHSGIPLAVIAGETEFDQNMVTVKEFVARDPAADSGGGKGSKRKPKGKQETIPQDDLIGYIRKKLAASAG